MSKVTEIMAREHSGLLAGPSTIPVNWQALSECLTLRVESLMTHISRRLHTCWLRPVVWMVGKFRCADLLKSLLCFHTWNVVMCILWMDFAMTNARAAVQEYQRRFPDRRIPSRSVFTWIHQTLLDHVCGCGELYMMKTCILTTIKGYNIWNQATMLGVWIFATG
jgi:hypothetical protein